jgi:hypothetical protein
MALSLPRFDPKVVVVGDGPKGTTYIRATTRELFVREERPVREERYFVQGNDHTEEVRRPGPDTSTETSEKIAWTVWDKRGRLLGIVSLSRVWYSENPARELWTWQAEGRDVCYADPGTPDTFRPAVWEAQRIRRAAENREIYSREERFPKARGGRGERLRPTMRVGKRRQSN